MNERVIPQWRRAFVRPPVPLWQELLEAACALLYWPLDKGLMR